MKNAAIALWVFIGASMAGSARADNIMPFTTDSFAAIRDNYDDGELLVGLWSMHCAPCLAELKLMGEILAEKPELPFVLISTDPMSEREYAVDILEKYGLSGRESWMFANTFAERLRYSIDPEWYGELPRSYFFDAEGSVLRHSGTMTLEQLNSWFDWDSGTESVTGTPNITGRP